MYRRSIPQKQNTTPPQLALQVADEFNDLLAFDTAFVDLKVKTVQTQTADDRKALPIEALMQIGSLPPQSPSPDPRGLGAQSTFINKDNDSPLLEGLFFKAGHLLRLQARTCLSSRSMARRSGLWQEKPMLPSTRHTWPG